MSEDLEKTNVEAKVRFFHIHYFGPLIHKTQWKSRERKEIAIEFAPWRENDVTSHDIRKICVINFHLDAFCYISGKYS